MLKNYLICSIMYFRTTVYFVFTLRKGWRVAIFSQLFTVFVAQAYKIISSERSERWGAIAHSEKLLLNGLLRSDEMLDVAPQGFVNSALLLYACAFAIQIGVVLKIRERRSL